MGIRAKEFNTLAATIYVYISENNDDEIRKGRMEVNHYYEFSAPTDCGKQRDYH